MAHDAVCLLCREVNSRRRALVAEEQSERANKALQEAEQERHLVEQERQDRTRECLSWREKHQALAEVIRAQEELKSLRQTKAVSPPDCWVNPVPFVVIIIIYK